MYVSEIRQYLLFEKCEKLLQLLSFFFNTNISVFGYKVKKHLTRWPLNELVVKLTMLWTTGPRVIQLLEFLFKIQRSFSTTKGTADVTKVVLTLGSSAGTTCRGITRGTTLRTIIFYSPCGKIGVLVPKYFSYSRLFTVIFDILPNLHIFRIIKYAGECWNFVKLTKLHYAPAYLRISTYVLDL